MGRRRKLVLGILFVALLFIVARYFGAGSTSRATSSQSDMRFEPLKNSNPSDTSRSSPEVGRSSGGHIVPIHQLIRQLLTPPNAVGGPLESAGPGRRRKRDKRRGRGRRRGARADHKIDYSQHGQSAFVDRHLNGRRGGFYVESGASDGKTGSNSLFFELERNWTGLLVEANPQSFASLLKMGRRAWALNACLSPTGGMTTVRFRPAGGIGGIVDHMPPGHRKLVDKYGLDDVNVTCFAFDDVIAALPLSPPVERIDYWSLDVEGAELSILGTIKWSEFVPIDVISVEYKIKDSSGRTDGRETESKLTALRQYFAGTGLYRELGTIKDVDVIFGRIEHEQKHDVIEASQQDNSISSSSNNNNNNQANVSGSSKVEEERLDKDAKGDVSIHKETNGEDEQKNKNENVDDGGVEDGGENEDGKGDDGGVEDGGEDEDGKADDGGVEDGGENEDGNEDDSVDQYEDGGGEEHYGGGNDRDYQQLVKGDYKIDDKNDNGEYENEDEKSKLTKKAHFINY